MGNKAYRRMTLEYSHSTMLHTNNTDNIIVDKKQFHIDIIKDASIKKTISVKGSGEIFYLAICTNGSCDVTIETEDENAQSHVFAICPSKDKQACSISITSKLMHSHTHSEMFLLSLAGDHAQINIDGGVYIGPGIEKPAGHLTEKNIILGKNTKVDSLPFLDVHSNDVQASHGASIDKLSENDLFYMRAKWLTRQESWYLMVQWYIDHILTHFNEETELHDIAELKTTILDYILS